MSKIDYNNVYAAKDHYGVLYIADIENEDSVDGILEALIEADVLYTMEEAENMGYSARLVSLCSLEKALMLLESGDLAAKVRFLKAIDLPEVWDRQYEIHVF